MACLAKDGNGWRILFVCPESGRRKTVRIGRMAKKDAITVQNAVERLVISWRTATPVDSQTAGWLAHIGDDLYDRLARVGLVERRGRATLGGLLQRFYASRQDVKPATRTTWDNVRNDLLRYFGAECRLADIDRDQAEAFRSYLVNRELASATISRRLQTVRQFFEWGVDKGVIEANPFTKVRHAAGNPRYRLEYIKPEETQRLIDAAPDWVWRTIIVLVRYGGLRCPSEVLSLRWQDVDLPAGRMAVPSPKTEHRAGHSRRVVPIFARLRPYLEEAWDMAAEGQTHVIPEDRYLPSAIGPRGWVNCNLRTTFKKIVRRAGLEPWPRLFHNLRASCETDLVTEYPLTTACQWIGNSPSIAAKHYVQATDRDFQRACGLAPNPLENPLENPAQNPAQ